MSQANESPADSKATAILELLLAELDVPVLFLDRQLHVVCCNSAFRRLYRLPENIPPQMPLLELLPELAGKSLILAVEEALKLGFSAKLEPTISNQFFSTRILVHPDGAMLVFEDQGSARQLEQMRWEIVDGMAHTFQTPLTSIAGYAETMLRAEELDAETQRGFLERIQALTASLIARVQNLLFLSRIERSEETPRSEVDIRALPAVSLKNAIDAVNAKGIELLVELGDVPVRVKGDEKQLQFAVDNLIDNAIKYSYYGGTLEVQVERLGDECAISVADQGIGIDPGVQDRIFERFFRGDQARTGDHIGAGLGLALVNAIVKAHGGRVEVASVPGHGSRFTMILPVARG